MVHKPSGKSLFIAWVMTVPLITPLDLGPPGERGAGFSLLFLMPLLLR